MPHIGQRVRIEAPGWGEAQIVGTPAAVLAPDHLARLRAAGWGPYWVVKPSEAAWTDWTPGETLWVHEAELTTLEDCACSRHPR